MKRNTCRSCDSSRLLSLLDLGDQPWCNELVPLDDFDPPTLYPLHLVRCVDCTLLQLDFTVPKEVMFSEHGYLSGMTGTLREHFASIAKETIKIADLSPDDLIVDIGGNDGTQLQEFQKLGFHIGINIESASNIAQISRNNGVTTLNEFCNEEVMRGNFAPGEARAINAAGVFFHLEELHSVIEGILYVLADDGVFTVQCMYAAELIKNESYDMIYHEHLCYYTLKSLKALLLPYGLNVFDAYHSPIHSGSLIVRACKGSAYAKTTRLIVTETEDAKYSPGDFHKFADKMRGKRGSLKEFLVELKERGNVIYAYGAPAKGNTLLNYEGIDVSVIDKAVEINELKIGHKLPVSDIPITKEDPDDYPDYYLLLSHNFEEEILEKNADLIAKGVKFIIPFPEIRVVG